MRSYTWYLFFPTASLAQPSILDGGSVEKNPPADAEMQVPSLVWEDLLEKEVATHSSILAWEIPWTESLAGYSPWGHKRVEHYSGTKKQQQVF